MDRIIQLITERNHYLDKFYTLNEKELSRFKSGDFDHIETFHQTRDRVLNLLNCIEDLLSLELESPILKNEISLNDKKVIRSLLTQKDEIIQLIVEQDVELISLLDKEKIKIYNEAKSLKKGRKVIGAYKSKSSSSSL